MVALELSGGTGEKRVPGDLAEVGSPVRVMRFTLAFGLLMALLGTGLQGCAAFTEPLSPVLEQRMREYQATRSTGG